MATVLVLIACAIVIGPAAVTCLVPPRWLWGWLPVLGTALAWMIDGLRGADGPGGFGAYLAVGLFTVINVPTALLRLLVVAARRPGM